MPSQLLAGPRGKERVRDLLSGWLDILPPHRRTKGAATSILAFR